MPDQDDNDRVWDIVAKVGVGMLTTRFAGGLRARPVEQRPDRDQGVIRIITDVRDLKDGEVKNEPDVGLVVISPSDKAYLSVTARAVVTRDSETAAKIWRRTDDVWWPDGPDDPNVRVIVLTP